MPKYIAKVTIKADYEVTAENADFAEAQIEEFVDDILTGSFDIQLIESYFNIDNIEYRDKEE